ncbi:hypothetical protein N658DRAFT_524508 [Parathielavia hyrcaniae]|uniref:Cytochrome c oxidase assembly factor 3 n=1 Tax=Parathielavia hyrcaniae TaxID=113614 RepID=A0AAN6T0U5_9PEZI|nr:hypothetical protein N658DRAFT_524508 [Parathielavia hyrcaniae]
MGFRPSTYYDRNRQSPALIRARRPYLVRNAVTGLAASAFAIGIYAYTLTAIGQDEFEDVKIPDVPAKPNSQPAKS